MLKVVKRFYKMLAPKFYNWAYPFAELKERTLESCMRELCEEKRLWDYLINYLVKA